MNTHYLTYWFGIAFILLCGAFGAYRAVRRYGLDGRMKVWFVRVRNAFLVLAGIALFIGVASSLFSPTTK